MREVCCEALHCPVCGNFVGEILPTAEKMRLRLRCLRRDCACWAYFTLSAGVWNGVALQKSDGSIVRSRWAATVDLQGMRRFIMWERISEREGKKSENVSIVEQSSDTYRMQVGAGWIFRIVTRCVIHVSGSVSVDVSESSVYVPDSAAILPPTAAAKIGA